MDIMNNIINSEIFQMVKPLLTKQNLNILYGVILIIAFLFVFKIIKDYRLSNRLYNIEEVIIKDNTMKIKNKNSTNLRYFKALKEKIHAFYFLKKNREKEETVYMIVLSVEIIVFITCLFMNKLIFAIIIPLAIHFFVIKAIEFLTVDIHLLIQEQLPHIIKQMIKFLSKDSDLKTVFYETSRTMKEPLRRAFFDLSRRMITDPYDKCLMEFADEIDNIWIHSFAFIMVSYKETSTKADIVKNLRMLSDIIEKENEIREKKLTENKPLALINYCLGGVAFAGFIGNLTINPDGKAFFFNSLGGMICMIIGVLALLGTVLVNMVMTSKNGKG